jgi:hypothetical protein
VRRPRGRGKRMSGIERESPRLLLAALGLIIDGLSPTRCCLSGCREADVHEDRSAADKQPFVSTHSWDDYACRRKVIAAAA